MASTGESQPSDPWRKLAPEVLTAALHMLPFGETESIRRWWSSSVLSTSERRQVLRELRRALERASGDAGGKLMLLHFDLTKKSLGAPGFGLRSGPGDSTWKLVIDGLLERRLSPRRIVELLWNGPCGGDIGLRSALVARFATRGIGSEQVLALLDHRRMFRERCKTALDAIVALDCERAHEILTRRFPDLDPAFVPAAVELMAARGVRIMELLRERPGRLLQAQCAHALRELIAESVLSWDELYAVLETTDCVPSPEVSQLLHQRLSHELAHGRHEVRLRDYLARTVWSNPEGLTELAPEILIRLFHARERLQLSAATLLCASSASPKLFRTIVDSVAKAGASSDLPEPATLFEQVSSSSERRIELLEHCMRRLPEAWARVPARRRQSLLRDAYDGRPQSLELLLAARRVVEPSIPGDERATGTPAESTTPCAFILLDPERPQDLALVMSPLELAEPADWFGCEQNLRLLRVDPATNRVLVVRFGGSASDPQQTLAAAGIDIAKRFALRIRERALPTTLRGRSAP